MNEEDVRWILRELRDEPVPADSLARVRLAVTAARETASPVAPFWVRWKFAGLFVAVAAVVFFFYPTRSTRQAPARVAAVRQSVQTDVRPEIPVTRVAVPKLKNRRRPKVAAVQDASVVRIETADPDVVILLISD